jgi:hypothetical protein
MEFITGLPQVQGKECIFVVVNMLTKFAHFFFHMHGMQGHIGSGAIF